MMCSFIKHCFIIINLLMSNDRGILADKRNLWPSPDFALPKTLAGCPTGCFNFDMVKFHSSRQLIDVKDHTQIYMKTDTQELDKFFMYYCLMTTPHALSAHYYGYNEMSHEEGVHDLKNHIHNGTDDLTSTGNESNKLFEGKPWPPGQYCLHKMKKKDCPPGLTSGEWRMDVGATYMFTPNHYHVDIWSTKMNHTTYTVIRFCCNTTGDVTMPIELPVSHPFIMYPTANECQEVKRMVAQKDSFVMLSSGTGLQYPHPKFLNETPGKVIYTVCYYQRSKATIKSMREEVAHLKSMKYIILVVLLCIMSIVVLALLVWIWRQIQQRKRRHLERVLSTSAKNCYIQEGKVVCNSTMQTDIADCEQEVGCLLQAILDSNVKESLLSILLPFKLLTIKEKIGEGAFGTVFHGLYSDNKKQKDMEVAVKKIKETCTNEQIIAMIKEAVLMSDFQHPNVLCLVGVSIDGDLGLPMLLTPYMENRDLHSFLRKFRYTPPDQPAKEPPSVWKLVSFGLQVARGMEYLASQKFVHRDLASRNCLVSESLILKIADFGLSRDVYTSSYYRQVQDMRLPIKWMAIESLQDRVFSTYSDIWAYGVTLWEIFTLAKTPYPSIDNCQVLPFLEKGSRLEKPDICPDFLYTVMINCWQENPYCRPTFGEIVKTIEDTLMVERGYLALDDVNHHDDKPSASQMQDANCTDTNKDFADRPCMDDSPEWTQHMQTCDQDNWQYIDDITETSLLNPCPLQDNMENDCNSIYAKPVFSKGKAFNTA